MADQISDQFTLVPSDVMEGEPLQMHYIPLDEAIRWSSNPKLHSIGDIITSIKEHGFRDPPTYDSQLAALVEGNGRVEALTVMEEQKEPAPRGIMTLKDTGRWCMPVLFGVDASSQQMAQRYAIDHNNLVMAGGDFSLYDMSKLWDRDKYLLVLQDLQDDGVMPVTVDFDDLGTMLSSTIFDHTGSREGDGAGDGSPDSPKKGDEDKDSADDILDEVVVWVVTCHNTSIAFDVAEAIKSLLDDNPGWDAEIAEKTHD